MGPLWGECFSSLKVHIRQLSSRFSFFPPPSYSSGLRVSLQSPECYGVPEIPIYVFYFFNLAGNKPLSLRYDNILIHGPKPMPIMQKWQHPQDRSDKVDAQVPLWCSFSYWVTGTRMLSSF